MRPCNLCPHMKRITLPKIRRALETMQYEVTIDPAVAERRPPRRRAHAGGPLGEAAMQTMRSALRRLPRHHRRRPCRADDRAAAGAAARHPAGQGAIVRRSGLGLGPGRHRRRRGRGRPAGPARRRHAGGRRRPQRSGRRQPHRCGGAGGHHRARAPRRGRSTAIRPAAWRLAWRRRTPAAASSMSRATARAPRSCAPWSPPCRPRPRSR